MLNLKLVWGTSYCLKIKTAVRNAGQGALFLAVIVPIAESACSFMLSILGLMKMMATLAAIGYGQILKVGFTAITLLPDSNHWIRLSILPAPSVTLKKLNWKG